MWQSLNIGEWHKSKCHAERDQGQFKFREWLLPFSSEYFVYQFSVLKLKIVMWHYHFSCCFIWVWNLIPHIKGRTKGECIRDLVIVESIWARERESNRRLEKMALLYNWWTLLLYGWSTLVFLLLFFLFCRTVLWTVG
jgi:hypothetical protein